MYSWFVGLNRAVLLVVFVAATVSSHPSVRGLANAQGLTLIPNRKVSTPQVRVDESTQWALHVKSDVTVHSPLLRLRDVATPVDASAPWWDRLGSSIIGLMPLDEKELVIERSRLSDAVARSGSSANIQWTGASSVRIVFRRLPEGTPAPVQTASAFITSPQVTSPREFPAQPVSLDVIAPIPLAERERVAKLIQFAIDRYDVQLREAFDINIDLDQPSMSTLVELRRVDSIQWEQKPAQGINRGKVVGMTSRDPLTSPIEVELTPRPLVVVARDSLRRGHILTEGDLELIPAARNVSTDGVVTDIQDVVGLQVQTVLQRHRPVTRSSVAPVIVIERGDLVEVRVMGGGVQVATAAKSLAQGAQGALIPIETLEPRRKLLARVAGPGKVEILTRPPRVQ